MSTPARPMMPQAFNPNELPVLNTAGIQPVYANNAFMFNSPHDLRIVFTEIVVDAPNAKPRQELRASVSISYSEAQLLHQALTMAIQLSKQTPQQVAAAAAAHKV